MKGKTPAAIASSLLVLSASVLTACSAAIPGQGSLPGGSQIASGSGFEESGDLLGEYADAVKNFPAALPEGIQFPARLPDNFVTPGAHVEEGVASSAAYFYWLCAWEKEYLDANSAGDEQKLDSSLATLEKWEAFPFYLEHFDDPDGAWHKAVLAPAESGDPSGIARDFAPACSFYEQFNS
ncbi:MAG: hypothetical protein KF808_00315 [Cryobacterium sp.]|nr:hypothetical protein [Cryobacterium sp.]